MTKEEAIEIYKLGKRDDMTQEETDYWFSNIEKATELAFRALKVDIVRCKECKEYIKDSEGNCFCGLVGSYYGNTKPSDFCSRGCRKEKKTPEVKAETMTTAKKTYEFFEMKKKEKGVTNYRLCVDLDISGSSLTKWKQGQCTPRYEKLMLIAEYLGCNARDFYSYLDEEEK